MSWVFKQLTGFGWPNWLAAIALYLLLFVLGLLTIWAIYDCGKRDERADWQALKATEQVAAKAEIKRLALANKTLTKQAIAAAALSKNQNEKDLINEKTHFNSIINDLRNGNRKLRISIKAVPACAGEASPIAASGSETAGETRAELSESATQYVINYGRDADKAVIESNYIKQELTQCYAHVDSIEQLMHPPIEGAN